jgi:hypothetical protein
VIKPPPKHPQWETLTPEQRRARYGWRSEAEIAAERAAAAAAAAGGDVAEGDVAAGDVAGGDVAAGDVAGPQSDPPPGSGSV